MDKTWFGSRDVGGNGGPWGREVVSLRSRLYKETQTGERGHEISFE